MAQLSLGEAKWRMLRLALRKKRFTFADVRSMNRRDRGDLDWLIAGRFVAPVADEVYEITARGRDAADLGFYDLPEPVPPSSNGHHRNGKQARRQAVRR